MKMNIQRVSLSGATTKVSFDNRCHKWLVKNFTESDIYVSFESELIENESIKIASGCGQVCLINELLNGTTSGQTDIYIKGLGEVEVQQLCYR